MAASEVPGSRRRPSPRVRRNRRRAGLIGVAVVVVAGGLGVVATRHRSSSVASRRRAPGPTTTAATTPADFIGQGSGHLLPGSDPGVLPGPVLIADEGNDRLVVVDPQGRVSWQFPLPGDLAPGQEFKAPDDAFFTPDGKQIIATEEEFSVVTLIDVATRRIVWRYGTPGTPGSAVGHLSNPDDALVLPDGHVLTADIKNCRLLLIAPGGQAPAQVYGTTGVCRHAPPATYGSPNGAFPMVNGHYLVTEINGDWVDEIDLAGTVYSSTHPPGVAYPSDTNEVSPGVYLTADFSQPGQLLTFDATGHAIWQYRPTGADSLNQPSLALPLPNGDVIATDDHNDRIIVVDPHTNQVVWQYGVRSQAGNGPGLLNGPDGLDMVPPGSDLVRHAATMGLPG